MRSVARRSGVPAGGKISPPPEPAFSPGSRKIGSPGGKRPPCAARWHKGEPERRAPAAFLFFDNRTSRKKNTKKINIVILILHCKTLYYHNGASGIQSE